MAVLDLASLQQNRTAEAMLAYAHQFISIDGGSALSDDEFYRRSSEAIKKLQEEYYPLAVYLKSSSYGIAAEASLSSSGSPEDGNIFIDNNIVETIQIVHGTENYSDSLKRHLLNSGEVIFGEATYTKQSEGVVVIESTMHSPGRISMAIADLVIERIIKKLSKGYSGIDTLLVYITPGISTPNHDSVGCIFKIVSDWINARSRSEFGTFKQISLVADKERVMVMDVQLPEVNM